MYGTLDLPPDFKVSRAIKNFQKEYKLILGILYQQVFWQIKLVQHILSVGISVFDGSGKYCNLFRDVELIVNSKGNPILHSSLHMALS